MRIRQKGKVLHLRSEYTLLLGNSFSLFRPEKSFKRELFMGEYRIAERDRTCCFKRELKGRRRMFGRARSKTGRHWKGETLRGVGDITGAECTCKALNCVGGNWIYS